jgi:hypothetical protein
MPRPNFLFTALRGADDDYRTLIVPFVLGYAFELAIYHLDHKRFGQALERFDRLVELVDAADGTRVGRNGTPRGRRPTKITRG